MYAARLWAEVDRILYQNYMSPKTVTDFWQGDEHAILTHLAEMKDRVIRSIVIMEYVEIDDLLNRAIVKHFFRARSQRRGKRYATLQSMLGRLYPQQKLDTIKTFKQVPRDLCGHIMALNDLRNSFAHKFDLSQISRSKRLYKGKYDVFTKAGLERFKEEMWEVYEFFQPEVMNVTLELVKRQREHNEEIARHKP